MVGRWQRSVVCVATAVLVAACGPSDTTVEQSPSDDAADTVTTSADGQITLTDETNELYADFIDCEPLPDPVPGELPAEMVVPDGFVLLELSEVGPLVSARGLLDATPVDVRDAFIEREDVSVVYLEDEGFEAEVLVDSGDWRTYIKASVRCRTGSVVQMILGPDDEAATLPVPGQAQAPPE